MILIAFAKLWDYLFDPRLRSKQKISQFLKETV